MSYHNVRDSKGRFTKPAQVTAPKAKRVRNKKQALKNYIGIAIDNSGSMSNFRNSTVKAVDSIVQGIVSDARRTGIYTQVSLLRFGQYIKSLYRNVPPEAVDSIEDTYSASESSTRLYDAVGQLIAEFMTQPDANDPHVSFLLYIITDGQENASQNYDAQTIKNLIASQQQTDRWTFGYHVPDVRSAGYVETYFAVPRDNIRVWTTDAAGMETVRQTTMTATTNFYDSRTVGATKCTGLFTTDLSKVTAKSLATQLTDASDRFKLYEVPKEQSSREFVESKTKTNYVEGQLYYQLMKPERLQASKQIVLMEKGKKAVWSGSKTRNILGLPNTDVKVTPGNHGNFDIFVQSAAPNRILPRGTKVLIDTKQTVAIKSTWDHQAAEAIKAAKLAAEAAAALI